MLAAQAAARPAAPEVHAPGGRPAPEVSVPEPPDAESGDEDAPDAEGAQTDQQD